MARKGDSHGISKKNSGAPGEGEAAPSVPRTGAAASNPGTATEYEVLLSWEQGQGKARPGIIRALPCSRFELSLTTVGLGLIIGKPLSGEARESGDTGEIFRAGNGARDPDEATAKAELRRVALLVNQLASGHGFLAPLVVVVHEGDEKKRHLLEEWARDQDWHKGQFSLFTVAEVSEARTRLQELLNPQAADPIMRDGTWDVQSVYDRVRHHLEEDSPDSPLVTLADELQHMPPGARQKDCQRKIEDFFLYLSVTDPYGHDFGRSDPGPDTPEVSEVSEGLAKNEGDKRDAGDNGESVAPDHGSSDAGGTREVGGGRPGQGRLPREDGTIHRVKKASIHHFRGFRKGPELDLDADLVLILGPNGHGKSSLMEALLLGLTGYATEEHRQALRVTREPPSDGGKGEGTSGRNVPYISLAIQSAGADGGESIEVEASPGERVPWRFTRKNAGAALNWNQNVENAPRDDGGKSGEDDNRDDSTGRTAYAPGTSIQPELQYRLTAFLQDSYRDLYDEKSSAETLRDVMERIPEPVKRARKAIERMIDDLGDTGKKYGRIPYLEEELAKCSQGEREKHRKELRERTDVLEELYQACAGRPGARWPDPPKTPEGWADVTVDLLSRRGMLSSRRRAEMRSNPWRLLVDQLKQAIHSELQRLGEEGRGEGPDHPTGSPSDSLSRVKILEDAVRRLEKEIEALRPRAESADDVLRWLSPDSLDGKELPAEGQLTGMLRLLKEWAAEWSGSAGSNAPSRLPSVSPGPIRMVVEELALVDVSRAARLHDLLEDWERDHREAPKRLRSLEETCREQRTELMRLKGDLNDELQSWRDRLGKVEDLSERKGGRADDLTVLENSWRLLQEWEAGQGEVAELKRKLGGAKQMLGELQELLKAFNNALEASEELKSGLQKQVNSVLSRFALTRGLHEVDLEPREQITDERNQNTAKKTFQLRSTDGRSLPHFSTGQRGQIAVAWMVAQRQLAQDDPRVGFPHRVLLLDDVSTGYDLTNLVRESLLWRQLAYHPDSSRRFQVFLSSHHDDLTNRMLDLLVPPEGCEMRVLTFDNWCPESGPVIGQFRVDPSQNISEHWKKGFTRDIEEDV